MVCIQRYLPMKKAAFLSILWVIASHPPKVEAAESPVDLARIAAAFGFPVSELIIQNVLEEDRKVNGNTVLSAYRVSSKTPFAFYPVVITVAQEGTFVTNETKQLLTTLDSAPEGPISKGGRGPLGSLSLGNEMTGGLLIGEIRIPARRQPLDRPEVRMATFSVVNVHGKATDIRVAMLAAFSSGENLVKVPGGESYYQAFATPSGDKNYDEPLAKPQFDLRGTFAALTELVRKSPLVADAKDTSTSTPVVDRTGAPVPTATPDVSLSPTVPVAQSPATAIERKAPVWPWVVGGILALIVIVAVALKRRA